MSTRTEARLQRKAKLVEAALTALKRALMEGEDVGDELLLHAALDLVQWKGRHAP